MGEAGPVAVIVKLLVQAMRADGTHPQAHYVVARVAGPKTCLVFDETKLDASKRRAKSAALATCLDTVLP